MKSLPDKLTRKAIRQEFTKLTEAAWDHLFEHEKSNGLHEYRVEGPYPCAYYTTSGVTDWLITHGHYRRSDFLESAPLKSNSWSALQTI